MPPIITLTTDFGSQDGYAGAMKGKILSICPAADIVDITHSISPQRIIDAAFCMARSAPLFPSETIHVTVVDPTVGSQRKPLLIKTEKFWLLGPDNGVFSLLLEKHPPQVMVEIFRRTEKWRSHSSFDGLELFAPVAAYLAGGMELKNMGKVVRHFQKIQLPSVTVVDNNIMGEVMLFDRFGNAITNISGDQIHNMEKAFVLLSVDNREITISLSSHYAQSSVSQSDVVAIINSDGLLELSVFQGSIRHKYSLRQGWKVKVIQEF